MNNIELFIGLACLFWFFTHPWPALIVDWGRQSLFEIRDNVFLMAASGDDKGLSFENKLYGDIRREINMTIRFFEDITWGRMIWLGLVRPKIHHTKASQPVIHAILKIEDATLRGRLLKDILHVYVVVASVMVLRNPIMLILAMMVFVPLVALFSFLRDWHQKMQGLLTRGAGLMGIMIQSSQYPLNARH